MLDEFLKRELKGEIDTSQITGRVKIDEGAMVENSTIRGPVFIAGGCRIDNSFIGPFTSIGADTTIKDSSIEHSVILENCHVSGVERMADSVIGKNTEVIKGRQNFKAVKLFLGDDARVEF